MPIRFHQYIEETSFFGTFIFCLQSWLLSTLKELDVNPRNIQSVSRQCKVPSMIPIARNNHKARLCTEPEHWRMSQKRENIQKSEGEIS